jgi:hypothetical protein
MGNNDVLKIRDKREGNWFFIDNTLIKDWGAKLGPYGIAVYNVLAMHANGGTQEAFPSFKTIGALSGMSRRQVIRQVNKLESFNIIAKEEQSIRPGGLDKNGNPKKLYKSSTITLLHPDMWRGQPGEDKTVDYPKGSDCQSPGGSDQESPGSDCESQGVVTVSHPNKTNSKQDSNNKTKKSGAKRRPPPSSKKPLGVHIYHEVINRWPVKAFWNDIDEQVGCDQANLDRWQQTVKAYVGCGWNPMNVKTMLEYFDRGEIPGEKGQKQNGYHQQRNRKNGKTGQSLKREPVFNPYTGKNEPAPVS